MRGVRAFERERGSNHGGDRAGTTRRPMGGKGRLPGWHKWGGGESGDWTTVSYRHQKATRPVDRGHGRLRNTSRHGGYREDRLHYSGRRVQGDSRDFEDLRFYQNNNRFLARYHYSRPRYHHSRPSFHYSRPAHSQSRHSRTERGRSRNRRMPLSSHVSVSALAKSQGNYFASRASFYVTNIPDHVQYVDFRKAFEVCGILSDVYVSRNRNARGQNYGFVCFINVKDVAKLQKALNNVYFGQNKVWANVVRFDRFGEVKKELLQGLEDGRKSEKVEGKKKSKNSDEGGKKMKKKQLLWEEKKSRKIVLMVKKILWEEKTMREKKLLRKEIKMWRTKSWFWLESKCWRWLS